MKTFSLSFADMSRNASAAMSATVEALVDAGLLDPFAAERFLDSHTALVLEKDSVLDRIARKLGLTDETGETSRIVVVRVVRGCGTRPTRRERKHERYAAYRREGFLG